MKSNAAGKRIGVCGIFLATAVLSWTQLPAAQRITPGNRPAFDVASIKPNKSVDIGGALMNLGQPGGRLTITKFSLRMLMGQAYNLPTLSDAFDRIVGPPDWADSEYFDIEARAEGNPGPAQKRLMLQSLLSERFKLAMHHETRQRPVYALTMIKPGKSGPQLQPHVEGTACEARPSQPGAGVVQKSSSTAAAMSELQKYSCDQVVGGLLPSDPNQAWSGGRRVSMETIAASLGGLEEFDRPILDRTGRSGTFDFTVIWHTQLQALSTTPSTDPSGVSLREALQEQLGLKLVSETGPVDVLVIDHVERPTTN